MILLDEINNIGHSNDILYGLPHPWSNNDVDDICPVVVGTVAFDCVSDFLACIAVFGATMNRFNCSPNSCEDLGVWIVVSIEAVFVAGFGLGIK